MVKTLVLSPAIAVLLLSQTTTPNPSFRAAVPISAGGISASIADVNNDGKNDLIALTSGNRFSVSFGNGDGTFQTPQVYSMAGLTGALPDAIAVADFNHDGYLDLAVVHGSTTGLANGFGNQVTVHINDKKGGFSTFGKVFVTGGSDVAISAGDINSDGNIDLAIGSLDAGAVYIHYGKGDGTFGSPTVVQTGAPYVPNGYRANALALHDVNSDGKLDLVISNMSANSVTVLIGNGKGSFSSPQVLAVPGGPIAIVAGNFGIHGNVDIAVALANSNALAVLAGNGQGGFASPSFYPVAGSPGSIAVADIFNRGTLDLITASLGSVSFLTNNLAGGFNAHRDLPVPVSSVFAMGRIDGDGLPDLALAYAAGQSTEVMLNDSINDCFVK